MAAGVKKDTLGLARWLPVRAALLAMVAMGVVPVRAQEEDTLFRQVRKAVTDEDDEALRALAAADPWSFREVTHQLADLAVEQGGGASAAEAFTRLFIAGHLAAIYMELTGDETLAARLQKMMSWTGYDMQERALVDDLMAGVDDLLPPSPQDLERVLPTCQRLGDLRCTGLLQGAMGELQERAGQAGLAALHYEKAADAFRRAGELRRLRDAHVARGQLLLGSGGMEPAAEALGAAAAVSGQIGDGRGQATALLMVAQALAGSGRRQRAIEVLAQTRTLALQAGDPGLAARAILMRLALRDGDQVHPGAAGDLEAAARLAADAGDLPTVIQAYGLTARALAEGGDDARAAEMGEKALAAARLSGTRQDLPSLLLLGAELNSRLGRWDRTVSRLAEAAEILESVGDPAGQARALELLGMTFLEAGRPEEAEDPLTRAAALARSQHLSGSEGRAEGGLGAVALALGDLDAARRHYERSARLLREAGDEFESLRMRRILDGLSGAGGR